MRNIRLGQISFISFASRLFSSIIAFVATLYVARELGAAPLGIYNLTIAVVSWLAIFGRIGFAGAISKRVSEGDEQGAFAIAGMTIIGVIFVVLLMLLFFFRTRINTYIGYSATGYVVVFLFAILAYALISSMLTGLHLVYIKELLSMVKMTARGVFQILLVSIGLSTAGLFIGHITGFLLAISAGGYFIYRELPELSLPRKRHYARLIDFAKYSWLGGIEGRMFNYTDVIVLGIFVSQTLIGVYSVAWNISVFFLLFSSSLQSALFPEMSKLSSDENAQAVSHLLEQSLTYAGLILIPGLFGGALLGERILRIYGKEFPQGATILVILIAANLLRSYQGQLVNALNAIDRPDYTFRTNLAFISGNLVLNFVLISLYGWTGAAIATATSAAIGLLAGYYYSASLVDFDVPVNELGKQWAAAIVMAVIVYAGLEFGKTFGLMGHNVTVVFTLVVLGAGVYFFALFSISTEFRETVDRNLPVYLPLV